MHLIPKRKNEIAVVKTTNAISTMKIKEIEVNRMTHDWWLRRWWRWLWRWCGIELEGLGGTSKMSSRKGFRVFPNVEEVSLVDGVFDGAFGGDGYEDVVIGEGVDMALEEEAWVEAMKIENEEDEDDGKSGEEILAGSRGMDSQLHRKSGETQ
ncbi:hypothetical protein Tco_1266037 [Tanacetum coccineum]